MIILSNLLSDYRFIKRFLLVAIPALLLISDFPLKRLENNLNQENEWRYTNPGGAAIQNFRMTKSPEKGYPPSEHRFAAFKKARQILEDQKVARTLLSTWVERGPVNVGGRTRAIMFDPNDANNKKVWAGGVSGGIWSNNDITTISSSWEQADDFMANLAVTTLAYDPLNPTTFYAGTGEGWQNIDAVRGAGIFKSVDAGNTWSQLANTTTFFYVQKLVVTPQGTILAAVKSILFGGSGIFRSTDQGANWTKVIDGAGADIEIGQDGTILASTGIFSPGSMYRSTDDGDNWTSVSIPSNGERIEIAIAPSNPNIAYAVASKDNDVVWIAKSINGGSSWTQLNIPTGVSQNCSTSSEDFGGGQAWYNLILAIHPTNPDQVIAGGLDLHSSLDGGTTWTQVSHWTGGCFSYVHADQHALIFRPGSPNELVSGNDGGIFYTSDITATSPQFSARNNNYNVTQFYSLALENTSDSNYILGGTQDNGTHQFNSTGLNNTTEVTGGDGGFCFIDQDLSLIQLTSYIGIQYFLSTNGGQNFQLISDDTDKGLFINPCDYDDYLNILYAAGDANEIIRYSNLETSPISQSFEISLGQVTHIKQSDRVKGRIFVGTDGGNIFRIENANTSNPTVFLISSDISQNGYISSIAIGENDDQLLITFSNYEVTSVFQSTDGGLSWTSKEGDLPDMPVRWALYDPSDMNKALLATESGLWSTTNLGSGSPNWVPDNEGLANVRCDMLQFRKSDGLAGVATHGRGIFTTSYVNLPIADFQITNPVTYVQQEVEFRSLSYKAGNSSSWTFGDGGSSSLSNTTHSYDDSGVYDISLSIANGTDLKTVPGGVHVLPALNTSYTGTDGGDFESNSSHFASNTLAGSTIELGSSSITGKNGTNSGSNAWVLDPDSPTYKSNTMAYLYTPVFNLSNPGSYTLSFSTKYDIEEGWDGFYIEVSTDHGNQWTKLSNNLDPSNWYNIAANPDSRYFEAGEPIFSGTTNNSFVEKTADLSSFAMQEYVAFRFVFLSDETVNNAGFAIDDFIILAPTTAQFTVSQDSICNGESVTYTNQSTGVINSYLWDFGESASPATATGEGPHQVTYSSVGSKDVSLTINGSSTELKSGVLNVFSLPDQITAEPQISEICFGEIAEVTFSGLESGVEYKITNTETKKEIITLDGKDGSSQVISFAELETNTVLELLATNMNTGCESEMNISPQITVIPLPTPTISQEANGTLTTTSAGDTFQWYFENSPISGATAQSYDPDLKGSYSVEVEASGCSAISAIFNVIVVGISDDHEDDILIYPNPVEQFLTIETTLAKNNAYHLYLINMDGRIVVDKLVTKEEGNKTTLNLEELSSGVYILKLKFGSTYFERTIFKK